MTDMVKCIVTLPHTLTFSRKLGYDTEIQTHWKKSKAQNRTNSIRTYPNIMRPLV